MHALLPLMAGLLFVSLTGSHASAVTVAWDVLIPGTEGFAIDMATLDSSSFLLLSSYDRTDDSTACRVARLDDRAVVWIRSVVRGPTVSCGELDAGPDALYVGFDAEGPFEGGGGEATNAHVRKLTSAGETVWTRSYAGADSEYFGGVAAAGGGVYVSGQVMWLDSPIGDREYSPWLRRYDADGTLRWTRLGPRDTDAGIFDAVSVDTTGVYVGWSWRRIGAADAAVRKYAPDGSLLWETRFQTGDSTSVWALDVGIGTVAVGGTTRGAFEGYEHAGGGDAWAAGLDPSDGSVSWVRQFGSTEYDYVESAAVGAGRVYVGGATSGSLPRFEHRGDLDAFARGFDLDGRRVWMRQYGGRDLDMLEGIVANATGALVVGVSNGNFGRAELGHELYNHVRQWQPA